MKQNHAAVAAALASSRLFGQLKAAARSDLVSETNLKRYSRGAVLFQEGDAAQYSWFVINGLVKLARITPKGQELVIELAAAEDLFGAVYYHEHPVYPATAIAIVPSTVVFVPVRSLESAMERDPRFQRALLADTCKRLCRAQELRGLALEPVAERLAWALSYLGEKLGREITASRALLAQLAGTTVETAIRITGQWVREGWLEAERSRMIILDRDALQAKAGGGIHCEV
jgi:CRP-like cAMP-binding protein